MTWFYEKYVGIANDVPVGLLLCTVCREIPNNLQNESIRVKDELQELKITTQLNFSAVNALQNDGKSNLWLK